MAIVKEERIGGQRLILGDCLEVMPLLGEFDAVVTDPPYGIAKKWTGGCRKKSGWSNQHLMKSVRNKWDENPLGQSEISQVLNSAKCAIIWGGNYFPLPPSRCWLIWVKPERNFSLAEAEMAWTNIDAVVRVVEAPRSESGRVHPTQKPLSVIAFCLNKVKNAQTIIDPFMGSGTTLVACQKLGRAGTGIELDPDYFDIACKRVDEATRQPDLFVEPAPKPTQEVLL